jgi:hypothetical protein
MAEYIERETAVRAVMAAKWADGSDGAMAMEIVASPAAADVAPVVRCKDCKHLVAVNLNGKGIPTCRMSGMEVAPDEFCSRGEKERRC